MSERLEMAIKLSELRKKRFKDYTPEDYVFLHEQAEHVEELEREVNDWESEAGKWSRKFRGSEESHLETKELLNTIVRQNQSYRQALKRIRLACSFSNEDKDEIISTIYEEVNKALKGESQ